MFLPNENKDRTTYEPTKPENSIYRITPLYITKKEIYKLK